MSLFTVTPFGYLVKIDESGENLGGGPFSSSLQDMAEDSKVETFAMILMWELEGHMKRLEQQQKEIVRILTFQAIF